jgi:hypothetical protein
LDHKCDKANCTFETASVTQPPYVSWKRKLTKFKQKGIDEIEEGILVSLLLDSRSGALDPWRMGDNRTALSPERKPSWENDPTMTDK